MDAGREFDFWLGDWDCRWEGGHGSNTVTAELDGAVILERFDGRPGTQLRGISVSVYEGDAAEWRQTWVDSTHAYLDFLGRFADDEMILSRPGFRMRFTEIERDSLVWLWERRRNGKDAWELCWQIDYSRRV